MFKAPFSFNGRIRRTEYGISLIIYLAAYMALALITNLTDPGTDDAKILVFLLFFIPVIWFVWAQGAKRCHDMGNSGWYQIIPLFFLFMLFKEGEAGNNNYGFNPKVVDPNDWDFLKNDPPADTNEIR
jgi:uncharacterized membrane protein YhaH (DUF805 family)